MINLYSILVVEDEPMELDFLKSIVEKDTHSDDITVFAKNGIQAVSLAKKYKPDIIIMDIMLPEMNGLQAIQEIRKFLPKAFICIITAYMEFKFAQEAVRLHVYDYLLKPVKPSYISETLKKMMEAVDEVEHQNDSSQLWEHLPIKDTIEDNHQTFVEESIKYIQKHYKEKVTLQLVASQVFVNAQYFSRIFKKETGVTFTDYVNNLRIKYACKLLETTNYPAYRISSECGFSDPSYFNRVFCAQMNMTPQKYKKCASVKK